jgi:hypothetical protein
MCVCVCVCARVCMKDGQGLSGLVQGVGREACACARVHAERQGGREGDQ